MSREGPGRRHKGNGCQIHEQMFCMSMVGAHGKKQNICLQIADGSVNDGFIVLGASDFSKAPVLLAVAWRG